MRTKMSAAFGTHDLDPRHANTSVLVPKHRTGDRVIEGWPPAARVELGVRAATTAHIVCVSLTHPSRSRRGRDLREQRCATACTFVDALLKVLVVLACARTFGSLLPEDLELLERGRRKPPTCGEVGHHQVKAMEEKGSTTCWGDSWARHSLSDLFTGKDMTPTKREV